MPFALPSLTTILAGVLGVFVVISGLYFWWSQGKIETLEQNVATLTSAFNDQKAATQYMVQKFKDYDEGLTTFNTSLTQLRTDVDKRNVDLVNTINAARSKPVNEIKDSANKITNDQFDRLSTLSRE